LGEGELMGRTSKERYKARKKAEAAARINYDNAKPHQLAALDAERDKLLANAMKRLPKSKAAVLSRKNGEVERE
jgi:hypothetical protein